MDYSEFDVFGQADSSEIKNEPIENEFEMENKEKYIQAVKRYQCEFCYVSMKYKSGLEIHIKAIHQRLLKRKCDTCKKEFNINVVSVK